MKILIGSSIIVLSALRCVAQVIVAANGRTLDVGPWTEPQIIRVESDTGLRSLSRQSCVVKVGNPQAPGGRLEAQNVDLLYDESRRALWVGAAGGSHFVLGDRIYGVHARGTVRISPGTVMTQLDQAAPIQTVAARALAGHPDQLTVSDQTNVFLEFRRVFGSRLLNPEAEGRAELPGGLSSLKSLTVDRDEIRVSSANSKGDTLTLVLSKDFATQSAYVNGMRLLVLLDARLPAEPSGWAGPGDKTIESNQGDVKVWSCNKDFEFPNVVGSTSLGNGFRAVVTEAGNVWVGPWNCRLAVLGSRIVGFSMARDVRTLLVFAGPSEKISTTNGSVVAFAKLIRKFEEDLVAGLFKETRRINVPALFANDDQIAASELTLEWLTSDESGVSVLIEANLKIGYLLRIHCDPN